MRWRIGTQVLVATWASLAALGCAAPARLQAAAAPPPPPQDPVFVTRLTLVDRDRAAAMDAAAIAAMRTSAWYRSRRYPAFFVLGEGYGAVGRIELASCRGKGLESGYVHMHVTFGVGGAVTRAIVESPTRPSPEALGCIEHQLEAITVPVFEGGDVTLSKSLWVSEAVSGSGGGWFDDARWGGAGRVTVAP